MTDFGRRTGQGDMLKSVYDPNEDGVLAVAQTEADMKRSVYDANLDGVIAVAQTEADMLLSVWEPIIDSLVAHAAAHADQHEDGGSDEVSAWGLEGVPVAPILGDGIAQRHLRELRLTIDDGTDAGTLKCTITNRWNAPTYAAVDNIYKNTLTGGFYLSATGKQLILGAAIIGGNCRFAVGVIHKSLNSLNTHPAIVRAADSIAAYLFTVTGGTQRDMTSFVDTGKIELNILYITDA